MKKTYLITSALGLSLMIAQPAFADAETEALKKEIKMLSARIAQLEKHQKSQKKQEQASVQATGDVAALAPSAGTSDKSKLSVGQRLSIVERNQEVAQEVEKTKAATAPKFEYNVGKGISMTSADKQFGLRATGYIQADNRTFFNAGATGTTNNFLIRSARPVIETKLTDYFDTRVQIDFGRGATTLLDAYGDFHPIPGNKMLNIRGGEFKSPIGIERWQSESDVLFVERGQTTNLVPFRDIGLMAHGQLIPDQVEYQLAVLNGASDLQANTGDVDNNKDYAGRVFVHPLTWSGVRALEGLGLGVAGTYGTHQGSAAAGSSNLTAGYATFGQRTYFTYKTGVYANGVQWRFNPQLTYYYGPLGIIGEYVANEQEVKVGNSQDKLHNKAWEAIATYVITGEDASFDGVTPEHNFDPKNNQWGAFELLGRVSQLNVDKKAFSGSLYADPLVSSRSAFETTLGGTWYFSRAVKLNLDFSRTKFDAGFNSGRDHPDEKAVLSRAQFRF